MFGRSGKKKPRLDTITAFLGAGAEYRGQFSFRGTARIDGSIIGDIASEGTLLLGEGGRVEGNIRVGQLISDGQIVGDVEARQRAVLTKGSNLHGNLRTPVILVENGAVLNGTVHMPNNQPPSLAADSREALQAAPDTSPDTETAN